MPTSSIQCKPVARSGWRARFRRGFSIIELLNAPGISGFVLTGILAATVELTRTGLRVSNYAEMDAQVRRGLALLEADLKAASNLTWNSASDITLTIPQSGGAAVQYTYAWCPLTLCLFRVPGTNSAIFTGRRELIKGVPAAAGGNPGVTFTRLDRTGAAASTDGATKCLQISLTVSRAVGIAAKSTSPVSATFALRNKRISS
jgi:Tfp pilus assembly protein PilW